MTIDKLKSLASRIEALMDERDGIQADIRDVYAEAKSQGYVPKVLRKAITRKRMDPDKRDEEDAILDLYEGALSGPMRKAVAMARESKTAREIEEATGIDHATVARSVSLNKKSETKAKPTQTSNAAPALPVAQEEEADASADAAGHPSPPSDPVAQAINADPPSGREAPVLLNGQGTHPGTYRTCAENAQVESCGERAGALGASAVADSCTLKTSPLGPQDTADDGLGIPPFLRREKAEVMA